MLSSEFNRGPCLQIWFLSIQKVHELCFYSDFLAFALFLFFDNLKRWGTLNKSWKTRLTNMDLWSFWKIIFLYFMSIKVQLFANKRLQNSTFFLSTFLNWVMFIIEIVFVTLSLINIILNLRLFLLNDIHDKLWWVIMNTL